MKSGSHLVADGSGKKHALPTMGYSELQLRDLAMTRTLRYDHCG